MNHVDCVEICTANHVNLQCIIMMPDNKHFTKGSIIVLVCNKKHKETNEINQKLYEYAHINEKNM